MKASATGSTSLVSRPRRFLPPSMRYRVDDEGTRCSVLFPLTEGTHTTTGLFRSHSWIQPGSSLWTNKNWTAVIGTPLQDSRTIRAATRGWDAGKHTGRTGFGRQHRQFYCTFLITGKFLREGRRLISARWSSRRLSLIGLILSLESVSSTKKSSH